MNQKVNGGFKTGYSVNRIRPKNDKPHHDVDYDNIVYPSGILPFGFLLFLYGAGLIVALVCGSIYDPGFKFADAPQWPKYVLCVPAVTLCLNLLWVIGRTGLFNSFGYMNLKLSRLTHIHALKEKVKLTPINNGLDEINDYHSYSEYVACRQKCTKKWTYISLGTHTGLFVISLIIYLVVTSLH